MRTSIIFFKQFDPERVVSRAKKLEEEIQKEMKGAKEEGLGSLRSLMCRAQWAKTYITYHPGDEYSVQRKLDEVDEQFSKIKTSDEKEASAGQLKS